MEFLTVADGALSWDYTALVTPILTGFAAAVCAGIVFFVARKILFIIKKVSMGGRIGESYDDYDKRMRDL